MSKKSKKEIKVNLGCGEEYKKGWINVDIDKTAKADKYCDFNEKLPFENESVDYILCEQVIEHLDKPIQFLCECHRILKTEGVLRLLFPNPYWWRAKIDFLFNNFMKRNIYSPYHRILRPRVVFNVLRVLGFEVYEDKKCGGLSGLLFFWNTELRESCIKLKCVKRR